MLSCIVLYCVAEPWLTKTDNVHEFKKINDTSVR